MRRTVHLLLGLIVVAVGGGLGCNTAGVRGGSGTGGVGGGDAGVASSGSGGHVASGSGGAPMPSGPCVGLACQQSTCSRGACTVPACPGGAHTTVSGVIRDPAGKIPLYNITVYVPNGDVAPFVDGPSCDPCDRTTGTSLLLGKTLAVTRTDTAGKFTLGNAMADVPAGDNVPLVIQVGKWRRQMTIPHVQACTNTELTDANQLRLPANQREGNIPKMALTTGEADALECLLRKVGIADSEFTPETGTGRVNLYAGGGASPTYATTFNAGAALTPAQPWWESLDNLKKYDIILHSCEGTFGQFRGVNEPMSAKSPGARQALQDYADMGGRVFMSHWHVFWLQNGPPGFQAIGTFNQNDRLPNPYDALIDQGFATGKAMAQWMTVVGGSTMPGIVNIRQTASSRSVDRVTGLNVSQRWIYASTLTPPSVLYLSATTPIPGGECGRVVFSDLHVSAGDNTVATDLPAMPFPSGCVTTNLTPQEKVLEFMLFDISSCVAPIIP